MTMAGSHNHATNNDGSLRSFETMDIATETAGDAFETIEEMYGMIWWLAASSSETFEQAVELVEMARQSYRSGLASAPQDTGGTP